MKKSIFFKIQYEDNSGHSCKPILIVYDKNGSYVLNQSKLVTVSKGWCKSAQDGWLIDEDDIDDAIVFQLIKATKENLAKKIDFEFACIDKHDMGFSVNSEELDVLTKDEIEFLKNISIVIPDIYPPHFYDYTSNLEDKSSYNKYFDENYNQDNFNEYEQEDILDDIANASHAPDDAWKDILDGDGWKHGLD